MPPAPSSPPPRKADPERYSFEQLLRLEDAWLEKRERPGPQQAAKHDLSLEVPGSKAATPNDEPRVVFTNRDRFGVALSGGGMRSASFNLGLLQGLGAQGVLDHVDYLSTVSGGGYIGGFWTALRRRQAEPLDAGTPASPAPQVSPSQADDKKAVNRGTPATLTTRTGTTDGEPAPIRHLREYSRFLMPRLGFVHFETWGAIVAVLGGLIPSLVATMAFVAVCLGLWLGVVWCLFFVPEAAPYVFAGAILALHWVSESLRGSRGLSGRNDGRWGAVLVGAIWAGGCGVLWSSFLARRPATDLVAPWYEAICTLHASLLAPALILGVAAGVALLLRAAASGWGRPVSKYVADRATARSLAGALVWLLLAGLWLVALSVREAREKALGGALGGSAAFGGLFVWLWDWLRRAPRESNAERLLTGLRTRFKAVLPQLLAAVAVLLLLFGITVLLQLALDAHHEVWVALAAVGLLLATGLLLDPARIGLHDFYRSRIARAFLGAADASQGGPRITGEQRSDDMLLRQLKTNLTEGPIHLVCCAANNLGGDPLSTLYRGARSATLSPFAVSVGGFAAEPPEDLRLSSALTASAAAFNSQMGSVSMRLGPAVAFLMTALNLRLGLWLPHPLSLRSSFLLPGGRLLAEALGMTRCEPVSPELAQKLLPASDEPPRASLDFKKVSTFERFRIPSLHLSDGGHFENLGLYELVRRQCRYIVVSDATADPQAAFDDLANAVRRIREDFSVEIELDVGPLRPVEGRSKQHAVVGTIHYDGLGGSNKGTLLYFKPTMVGDEPSDVTQYQTRNRAFPHEGTADQFYDEAQWESYRRLGEHEANVVLRFLDRKLQPPCFTDHLFLEARRQWHPGPSRLRETFVELTERCSAIETELLRLAPARLRAEFFPEVAAAFNPAPCEPETPAEAITTLFCLMQVAQLMEDVWLAAELDVYWSHPLNEGWMNYFERWAGTPSFRRWWPVLRPIYGNGFRDFVKDRFGVRLGGRAEGATEPVARLVLRAVEAPARPAGLAVDQWRRRRGIFEPTGKLFEYLLTLDQEAGSLREVQVGLLAFETRGNLEEGVVATWRSSDLFVPPALIGGGIIARFLDDIVAELRWAFGGACIAARVVIDDAPAEERLDHNPGPARTLGFRRDPAKRNERVQTIAFYKSRGFVYQPREGGEARVLQLDLVRGG